jgi:hypothetical protein
MRRGDSDRKEMRDLVKLEWGKIFPNFCRWCLFLVRYGYLLDWHF